MARLLATPFFFVTLLAGSAGLSVDAHAQGAQPRVVAGVDCHAEESVKSLLDQAAITAGGDKSMIIIARLGDGESSRGLSRRRLSAPSMYLVGVRGVPEDRVITAEGGRVRGPGQVEVYVGGELLVVFKMKRNRDFGQGPRCKIAFD
jgi:hypothetical protein